MNTDALTVLVVAICALVLMAAWVVLPLTVIGILQEVRRIRRMQERSDGWVEAAVPVVEKPVHAKKERRRAMEHPHQRRRAHTREA